MSVVSAPTALAYSKTALACKRNFAIDEVHHPGVELRANRMSIADRHHLSEVAFVWELIK